MLKFNYHPELAGRHAFLGASKYHWVNYDTDKMKTTFANQFNAMRGTRLHEIAGMLIREKIKLPKTQDAFNMYVNDAIGFRMTPEQPLMISPNIFGTADAICFNKGVLRVHDLKTGAFRVNGYQVDIYAAMFCVEYKVDPFKIQMFLRIYQNDGVMEHEGNPEWIKHIMDKALEFDKEIEAMKAVML